LAEQLLRKQHVVGSTPALGTNSIIIIIMTMIMINMFELHSWPSG
jgi:hypothetical protein